MLERVLTPERNSLFFSLYLLKFIMMLTFFVGSMSLVYSEPSSSVKKIFCPSKIICSRDDDLSSCHHTSEDSLYWDHIWYTSSPHKIFAGEYNFLMVRAPYHASFVSASDDKLDNVPVCQYLNEQQRMSLGIIAKPEPNLEGYNDDTTQWHQGFQELGRDRCEESIQACPLKEAYSLAIFNNFDSILTVSVYDSQIPNMYIYQNNKNGHGSGYYAIGYEDVLPYCNMGTKCKIDFSTSSDGNIGSVLVDLDNAMRIIKIIPLESSRADIIHNAPFNSIKIEKSEKSPEGLPSISINNQTRTPLSITANRKLAIMIDPRTTGVMRSNRVLSVCNDSDECVINISTTYDVPNVGSFALDMLDKMRVIGVASARPSQIIVKQVKDSNLIEVSYPNFR